ncbi:hypothetical protein N7519_011243, partial [Penicillium mononematosum]|uniref:uncharacterized protein n=1 Tax=Penicillium mononematosum TaxID=268346 RepID=UPI0025495000
PDDTCTSAWRDGENWYILQPASEQPAPSEQSPDATPADSHEVRLIHTGDTLSAVWAIGNNDICKVHHWSSDTTSESETIKFVQKMAPQVPIPEVINSWVDRERSFLVLKRVPGITLRDAWGTMSATQQDSILNEVVYSCERLASITSERLQNVSGGPDLHPNPEIEERFHLYHPDLGPGNILIYNQRLAAIIDWECAGTRVSGSRRNLLYLGD